MFKQHPFQSLMCGREEEKEKKHGCIAEFVFKSTNLNIRDVVRIINTNNDPLITVVYLIIHFSSKTDIGLLL